VLISVCRTLHNLKAATSDEPSVMSEKRCSSPRH
jgi:hypothetical protein